MDAQLLVGKLNHTFVRERNWLSMGKRKPRTVKKGKKLATNRGKMMMMNQDVDARTKEN